MLNAFRHHGEGDLAITSFTSGSSRTCSTPFGITARGTDPETGDWKRRKECSTPFGITARGTVEARVARAMLYVLNAFRHHGEGDVHGGAAQARHLTVLNAFRHHGEGDQAGSDVTVRENECSTPFGITARGTAEKGKKRHDQDVLNAFRHHGEGDFSLSQCDCRGSAVLNAFRHHGEGDGRGATA